MKDNTLSAIRITPESLRQVLEAFPELGNEPINAIMTGYLVKNAPVFNKDGSVSKKKPLPYVILSREKFNERFFFTEKRQLRKFVPVATF